MSFLRMDAHGVQAKGCRVLQVRRAEYEIDENGVYDVCRYAGKRKKSIFGGMALSASASKEKKKESL